MLMGKSISYVTFLYLNNEKINT